MDKTTQGWARHPRVDWIITLGTTMEDMGEETTEDTEEEPAEEAVKDQATRQEEIGAVAEEETNGEVTVDMEVATLEVGEEAMMEDMEEATLGEGEVAMVEDSVEGMEDATEEAM
eukprot:GHVU01191451.1.p2 GENE.GHVU01191451.1~~GHVU01191451.1.p2  ORF type:complete len:115 (+),score=44.95 GHVU01191451.1:139-483(+)